MYKFFRANIRENKIQISGDQNCLLGSAVNYGGRQQGPYCEWNWDGGELKAKVDTLGLFGLFYYADNESIMISPSPVQLIALGASAELDPVALAVFSMIGWFPKQDTPFKHIKILPPAGSLVWKEGVLKIEGASKIPKQNNLSRKEAIDGFITHFRTAMANHLDRSKGKILMPLSGGRDSRHILFEMLHFGKMPDACITYGIKSSQDPEIFSAMEVVKVTGVNHEILEGGITPIQDQIRVLLLTHFCSDEHAQYITLRNRIGREMDRPIVFDGIGGDILTRNKSFTNQKAHDLCMQGRWEEAVEYGLILGNDKINGNSYSDRANVVCKSYFDEAKGYLVSNLKEFESAADPWTAFLFSSRTRREISLISSSILGDHASVRCPYLDLDLVDFLLALPYQVTSDGKFHDEIISTEFPSYSNIPYDNHYDAKWRKKRVSEKLRMVANGAAIASKFGFSSLTSTLFLELNDVLLKKKGNLLKWQLYNNNLKLIRSPEDATRFINILSELDEPSIRRNKSISAL